MRTFTKDLDHYVLREWCPLERLSCPLGHGNSHKGANHEHGAKISTGHHKHPLWERGTFTPPFKFEGGVFRYGGWPQKAPQFLVYSYGKPLEKMKTLFKFASGKM